MSESKSIIGLCDALLYLAIKERASDIHMEPRENTTNIRFRIDGRLQHVFTIAAALHAPLKSRIKILCNLNIAESRFPQDGRFSVPLGSEQVNFRVSVIPTVFGEKLVLRILALTGKRDFRTLDQMLMSQSILQPFKHVIRNPNGMIFVTGPTGSGKSTTLYAALHEINTPQVNICTIEDPVETRMQGIIQSQVNTSIDLKFSTLLRSLLRQDPDVILVGEIRDLETAKIATEAALTGHLVFSTLHTNNAIQAVVRLIELGIEPYMVAPSILAVLSQRLAARICENCKRAYTPGEEVLRKFFHDYKEVEAPVFYEGQGCPHCRKTGYRGRIAFHEMALITDEMRSLISSGASDAALAEAAKKVGYRPLRYDGLKKVLLGFTTVQELEAHASFDWIG
jgi:type IV pilus assembly protein PilB